MRFSDEPRIDCHVHVFDPARFAYQADTPYRPAGHELATAAALMHLQDAYGVAHALLVGPNSGYADDNRCMLDAIAQGNGRFKGIAVVANDISVEALRQLKAQGVVGVACNATFHGTGYYRDIGPLGRRLHALGMLLQIQVQGDQLLALLPALDESDVTVLVDHCGRPAIDAGLDQPGFQALLALGRSGRAVVKLSGYGKYSAEAFPHADTRPYAQSLLEAFTPARCVWGSDWPFLRAGERTDYGTLLMLAEQLMPDAGARRAVMWDTPARLFGFGRAG